MVIEQAPHVPPDFMQQLASGIITNFVVQGRGVAFVPGRRATPAAWRSQLEAAAGTELRDRVLIFDPEERIKGIDPGVPPKWDEVEYRLSKTERPLLSLIAFDTLESLHGGDALDRAYDHIGSVNRSGDIVVALTNPLLESNPKLREIGHVHVRFESINGSIVAFGEKPWTGLFHVEFSARSGTPDADLTPIV